MIALSGASLPAAVAAQPHIFKASFVIPTYRAVPRAFTDSQLVAQAAPERAILAAQAAAALAAAQAAAAAAAQAAAANAARAAAARASAVRHVQTASVPSGGGRVINVWTSGFQDQLNACRGGVDLTGSYGVRTVGEHWQCGGAAFPEAPGSIVTFTGLDAGTYKVLGVVATLNASTSRTSDLPHGYQMLFQTCRGGNSDSTIFIGLESIG